GPPPRLDGLVYPQRRAGARRERKALIDDVQRLVADQVYYLFPPAPQQIASWAPWLRGYQPRASGDRGAQLESVWLARGPGARRLGPCGGAAISREPPGIAARSSNRSGSRGAPEPTPPRRRVSAVIHGVRPEVSPILVSLRSEG